MSNYPLTKFVFLFIIGILIQSYFVIEFKIALIIFITLIFLLIGLQLLRKYISLDIRSMLVIFLISLCGLTYYSAFTKNKVCYPFDLPKYKNATVHGEITKIELLKEGRVSFQLLTDSVITDKKIFVGKYALICSIYDSTKVLGEIYKSIKIGNRIELISYIQKPRNRRNPFEFDYEKYLNDRSKVALANSYDAKNLRILSSYSKTLPNTIFEIRKYLDEKISVVHNNTTGAMLRGLILADRSGIDSQINQDFINAGVVHVLSVSGLHVGYIVIIFLFLFNRMNMYWRIILTVTGLFVYMIITGSEAPVFRSTVMASVILLAPLFGRESNSYNTLSLAAFIILLLNPVELFNPSFQLSFSAILSLIILFPMVKKWVDSKNIKSNTAKYLLLFFGSTLAAQIGTLPFTLVYFGRISITSILANLFVIPVSGIIVGLGIVSLVTINVSLWISQVFGSCNELLVYLMLWLVKQFGNPKYSIVSINQFSLYDGILFYLFVGLLVSQFRHFSKLITRFAFIVLVIATFTILSLLDNHELLPKNKLSVMMIDVGQGDSFLVKFPNGKAALIDAGEATTRFDNGKRIILPLLDKLGIDKIDYGFVSHVDADHYTGFISLIREGRIKRIYKPISDNLDIKDVKFEKLINENDIPIFHYQKSIMKVGNSRIYILNDSLIQNEKLSSNDRGGMLKLVFGNTSYMFAGDASIHIEKDYLKRYGRFLHSDVLKVGHHGSKTSSSERFISMVEPSKSFISSGVMNKFKHPSKEIVDRLKLVKSEIFRTDIEGAVLLQSDGIEVNRINWRDN